MPVPYLYHSHNEPNIKLSSYENIMIKGSAHWMGLVIIVDIEPTTSERRKVNRQCQFTTRKELYFKLFSVVKWYLV